MFGGLMWLLNCIIPFLFNYYWMHNHPSISRIFIGLPIWLGGGLVFGMLMQSRMNKKGENS